MLRQELRVEQVGDREADGIVDLAGERKERVGVHGEHGADLRVHGLAVPRLAAERDQSTRDDAHSIEVEVDQVVADPTVARGLVESTGRDSLTVLDPLEPELDAVVRELRP